MSGFRPGDIVRARTVDAPADRITGTIVGMSNASGALRLMLETVSGALVLCESEGAVVLQSRHTGLTASGGGGDPAKERGNP
jgi:hypothetical protein